MTARQALNIVEHEDNELMRPHFIGPMPQDKQAVKPTTRIKLAAVSEITFSVLDVTEARRSRRAFFCREPDRTTLRQL
jgi:hypothetical protein